MNEYLWGIILVVFVGVTFWFNHPAPSTNGLQPVTEESAHFHLLRHQGDGDGLVTVTAPTSDIGRTARYVLDDGRLYQADDEPDGGKDAITASVRPDYYLIDSTKLDLGAWSAYRTGSHTDGRFQVGVRYSPVRLFYGTIAPDLVASEDVIGAGLSVYPPERLVGRYFDHIGLGGWYGAPFDGGNPSWMFGLTFSTH
jgi:hypothetical protein